MDNPMPLPPAADSVARVSRTYGSQIFSRSLARNARSLVLDCDDDFVIGAGERDVHCLSHRAVLHGIVEKIEHDLPECLADRLSTRGPARSLELIFARRTRASGANASIAACISRSISSGSTITVFRPCSDPGESEDILDEVREALRFFVDDSERPLALRVGPELPIPQELGKEPDLRERSAKLMRDARDEIDAQLRELLLPPQLIDRRGNKTRSQRKQSDQNREARARKSADDELRARCRGAAIPQAASG